MDAAFIWKLSKLGRIGSTRQRYDDDFADRLNYQYTSVLLFLFIGLIGIRQYVGTSSPSSPIFECVTSEGKPIQCWIPQEFTRGWEEYAENYCWVANTYFAALWKRLPLVPDRRASHLVYYQWAPIVLATQALLFYLPCLLWRVGMRNSGFSVHRVLQLASESNDLVPEVAQKTVHVMARYLETCIHRQRMYRQRYGGEKSRSSTKVRFQPSPLIEMQAPLNETSRAKDYIQPTSTITTVVTASPERTAPPAYKPLISTSTTAQSRKAPSLSMRTPMLQKFRKAPPPPPPSSILRDEEDFSKSTTAIHFSSSLDAGNLETGLSEYLIKSPPTYSTARSASTGSEKHNKKAVAGKKKQASTWPVCRWLLSRCHGGRNYRWRRKHPRSLHGCCSRESGNFLTTLYCLVKCLYVVNAVGQIYLMERFVGARVTFYGAAVLADLVRGRDWQQSGHFPRVTFCDMEAKKLGKNHVYTIQCVLPINMFLEKIYIFLWFWHIILTVITIGSLFGWLRRLFWRRSRLKFVRHYLKVVNALPPILDLRDRQRTRQFVEEYLTADAFFLIRIIGANSGDLLASELTNELWMGFLGRATVAPSLSLLPMPSTTPARLCPKHAACSCNYCYLGERSKPYGFGDGNKSEGRIFGVKYYPGDKSALRHKISPNILHHLQISPLYNDYRRCPCETTETPEAVAMETEKSLPGKIATESSNGNHNTSEDIV
ncbi:unnamed protein product [Taenia asiatica]|uniref:Innexin n=1 Tax=Taenia asiatica TaxID=60517 RepID=A0A158R858_TAEAS|nr:unnamed protein product [Taenia asiatica]